MTDLPEVETSEAGLEHARALHRANSQIAEMRSSLSMLTSASAGLADALQKRNQQYDALLAYHGKLTERLAGVETELKLASAERATLLEQVDARNAQLAELHAFAQAKTDLEAQLAQAESDLAATRAELDAAGARLAELQSQADATSAEKADVEDRLGAAQVELAVAQAELAALDTRLASLEQTLGLDALAGPEESALAQPVAEQAPEAEQALEVEQAPAGEPLAEEAQAEQVEDRVPAAAPAPEAPVEVEGVEAPVAELTPGSRLARLGLITAAVVSATARAREQDVRLREAIAQLSSLQDQLEAVSVEKLSLEAGIQERDRSAADLQAQLDAANSRLAALQAEYDATIAAKADAEEKLLAAEEQSASMQEQLGEWGTELEQAVPEGERLAAVPETEAAAEPPPADAGEPEAEPSKAERVSAGINSAIAYGMEQEAKAKEATAQVAALQDQLDAANAASANLQSQLDAANASIADLQSQLDAANAASADLQSQLDAANASTADLQGQLEAAKAAQADAEQKLQATQAEVENLGQQVAELTGTNQTLEQQLQESEAEVAKFEEQLGAWQDALGEEAPEGAEEEKEGRGRRWLAKAGIITAGIHTARQHKEEQAAKLDELQSQLDQETAAKADAEQKLQASQADAEQQLQAAQADAEQKLQAAQAEAEDLKRQLASLSAAKAEADQKVLAGEARLAALTELTGLEGELRGWQAELATVLPPQEEQAEGAGGKVAVGMVAASIASVVTLARNKDSQLRDSAAELSALHEQVGALGAEKASLEASLAQQAKTIVELQAQLNAAMANKVETSAKLEAALAAPETPLAEMEVAAVEASAPDRVGSLVEPARELVAGEPAEPEPVAVEPKVSETASELPVVETLAAAAVIAEEKPAPVETAPEPEEAIEETAPWVAEPAVAVVEEPSEEAAAVEPVFADTETFEPAVAEPAAAEVAVAQPEITEPVAPVAAVAEAASDKLEEVGDTAAEAAAGVEAPVVEPAAGAMAVEAAEAPAEELAEVQEPAAEAATGVEETAVEVAADTGGAVPVAAAVVANKVVDTVVPEEAGQDVDGADDLPSPNTIDDVVNEIGQTYSRDDMAKFKEKLEYVRGIGPAYAAKLRGAGVNTVLELLQRGATRQGRAALVQATGITGKLILLWVNHADLYRIKGVDSEYASLLEAAGVDTVVELARRNPANLLGAMLEINEVKQIVHEEPAASQVEDWIDEAKKLPWVIQY